MLEKHVDTAHPWRPHLHPVPVQFGDLTLRKVVWCGTGGLSSGGEGCGLVSSAAWPLGTLTAPLSQAAGLPVHYLQTIPLGTGA